VGLATKQKVIEVGGISVKAGERQLIQLPIANLYTNTAMNLPVHVVNGRLPGPTMFISAAIHGDELNGVEIIRRLLTQRRFERLKGCLICVPVINSFGMLQHSRYSPDGRDLNRSFPGSEQGSLTARLCHIFLQQVVKQCDYGIDLHTGAMHRSNLPQIRGNLDDDEIARLASVFGVPVLLNANERDGSLRQVATENQVKVLLYEAGEALRYDEVSIKVGVNGILNVLRALDMIPAIRRRKPLPDPYVARSSRWLRAPDSGSFQPRVRLGDWVNKGDMVGTVFDPTNIFSGISTRLICPFDGIVIGESRIPLVNEGDALVHLARFEEDMAEVQAEMDVFHEAYDSV
jgi:predicted deacylase